MKITCISVLDYLKKKFLDSITSDDDCKDHSCSKVDGENPTPSKHCSPLDLKRLTRSLTRIDNQSKGPCCCSELNINGRALHYVIRVDDRNASLKFYIDIMGMKIQRNEEVPISGCKNDQPVQSKTIVGYGPEDNYFCLQLIYDCKKRNHLKGNECAGLTVVSSQALAHAKKCHWPIHMSNMLEAPDGLKIYIVDKPIPSRKDPIMKISLTCTNLVSSLAFWHGLLGLTLFQNNKAEKRAQIAFRRDEVQIELRQVNAVINRAQAFDRMVFACPLEELEMIQKRTSTDFGGKVIQPLTRQKYDDLDYLVLADPDCHEVCFVDDLKFRQISRAKAAGETQLEGCNKARYSSNMSSLKSCLKSSGSSRDTTRCQAPDCPKPGNSLVRSGIPVPIPGYYSPNRIQGGSPTIGSRTTVISDDSVVKADEDEVSGKCGKFCKFDKSEESAKTEKKSKSKRGRDTKKAMEDERKGARRRDEVKSSPDDDIAEDIIMDYLKEQEKKCSCGLSNADLCPGYHLEDLCYDHLLVGCDSDCDSEEFRNCLIQLLQGSCPTNTRIESSPATLPACTSPFVLPLPCFPPSCHPISSTSLGDTTASEITSDNTPKKSSEKTPQKSPEKPPEKTPEKTPETSTPVEIVKVPEPCPCPPKQEEQKIEHHITLVLPSDTHRKSKVYEANVNDGGTCELKKIDSDDSDDSVYASRRPKSSSSAPSCVPSRTCSSQSTIIPLISTMGAPIVAPYPPVDRRYSSHSYPATQYDPTYASTHPSAHRMEPSHQGQSSARKSPSKKELRKEKKKEAFYVPVRIDDTEDFPSKKKKKSTTHFPSESHSNRSMASTVSVMSKEDMKKERKEFEKNKKERKAEEKRRQKEAEKFERQQAKKQAKQKGNRSQRKSSQDSYHNLQSRPSGAFYESEHQLPTQPYPGLPYGANVPYIVTQCPPQCQFPEVGKVSPCAEINKPRCPYDSDDSEDIYFNNHYYHRPGHHHSRPQPPPPPPEEPLMYSRPNYAERGPAKVVYKIDAGGNYERKMLPRKPPPPPRRIYAEQVGGPSAAELDTIVSGRAYTNVPTAPIVPTQAGTVVVRTKGGNIKVINIQEEEQKKKRQEETALYKEMERLRETERRQEEERRKEHEKHQRKLEKERMEMEREKLKFEREKLREAEREKQRVEMEKLRIEKEKERVEREKEREHEMEKERLEKEKERVTREAEREIAKIQKEKERVMLEMEEARTKQMEIDRARSRRLIEAAKRMRAEEEALSPVCRVGFVSVETTNPHSLQEIGGKKNLILNDVTNLLEQAAKQLENSSIDTVCGSKPTKKVVSKLLKQITKSQKNLDQCIKKPANWKKIGSISSKRTNTKTSKHTEHTSQVISATRLSKVELKQLGPTLVASSCSLQTFKNTQLEAMTDQIKKISNSITDGPSWRKNLLEKYSPQGRKPSRIPMLDKSKLRRSPLVNMTASDIIEAAMKVPTKTPSKIFRKSFSAYIKRVKSREEPKVDAEETLPLIQPTKSPSQIIDEAMKTCNEPSGAVKVLVHEAVAASSAQKSDQVTTTVKDEGTNKALSKTIVDEGTNIDCADEATQHDRPNTVDKEVQEKTDSPNPALISTERSRLPDVVKVVQYSSEESSVESSVAEMPLTSGVLEYSIKNEEVENIYKMVKKLKKDGILKKIERNHFDKITRENIEQKIINEAMARVTSPNQFDVLQNISKSIADRVANLTSTNVHKLFKRTPPSQSVEKIDMKPPEPNVIKLETKAIEELQARLNHLESILPTTKQPSKPSIKLVDSQRKPRFSEVVTKKEIPKTKRMRSKDPHLKHSPKESIDKDFVQNIDKTLKPSSCRKCGEQIENAIKDTINNACPAPRRRYDALSPEERIQKFLQKRGGVTTKDSDIEKASENTSPIISVQEVPGKTLDDKLIILESNIKTGRSTLKPGPCEEHPDFRPTKEREVQSPKMHLSKKKSPESIDFKQSKDKPSKVTSPTTFSTRTSRDGKDVKISPYLQNTLNRIYQDVHDIAAYKKRGPFAFKEPINVESDHWKPIYKTKVQPTTARMSLNLDSFTQESVTNKPCRCGHDTPKKNHQVSKAIQSTQKRSHYNQAHATCSPIFSKRDTLEHPSSNNNRQGMEKTRSPQSRSKDLSPLRRNPESVFKKTYPKESGISTIAQERIHQAQKKTVVPTSRSYPPAKINQEADISSKFSVNSDQAGVTSTSFDSYLPNKGSKNVPTAKHEVSTNFSVRNNNKGLVSTSFEPLNSENWIHALNKKTVEILKQSAYAVENIRRRTESEANSITMSAIKHQISELCITDTSEKDTDDSSEEEENVDPMKRNVKVRSFEALVPHNKNHSPSREPTSTNPTYPSKITDTQQRTDEEEIEMTHLIDSPEKRRHIADYFGHPHSDRLEHMSQANPSKDKQAKDRKKKEEAQLEVELSLIPVIQRAVGQKSPENLAEIRNKQTKKRGA